MTIISKVSRSLDDYQELIRELSPELGERFPVSMQNWCGIGSRPYPLKHWYVYLATLNNTTIGIYSYYQQMEDPHDRWWVGWIGVRPTYRRQGYGIAMLRIIRDSVVQARGKEIWVHTSTRSNKAAIVMYESFGMERWGSFSEIGLEQASAGEDSLVLKLNLE